MPSNARRRRGPGMAVVSSLTSARASNQHMYPCCSPCHSLNCVWGCIEIISSGTWNMIRSNAIQNNAGTQTCTLLGASATCDHSIRNVVQLQHGTGISTCNVRMNVFLYEQFTQLCVSRDIRNVHCAFQECFTYDCYVSCND